MIKFNAQEKDGGTIFAFILEPENIEYLKQGKPIHIYLVEFGTPSKDSVLIAFTDDKDKFVKEIQKHMKIRKMVDKTKETPL